MGPILEPGGRWEPILDLLKKQTPKKSPAAFTLGSFLDRIGKHFGIKCGIISVFGGLLACILVNFRAVWGPSGDLKTWKNVCVFCTFRLGSFLEDLLGGILDQKRSKNYTEN